VAGFVVEVSTLPIKESARRRKLF